MQKYDRIIIGAGLYGLYSALFCGRLGMKVLVLEKEAEAFTRATYVNQARVHMGYHYPRSLATAIKSAGYFTRFCSDYDFCIHSSFDQVYATSKTFSWTDASQFKAFCDAAEIRCEEISPDKYFIKNCCDGAFLTTEYTYDAKLLRDYFINEINKLSNIEIKYNINISRLSKDDTSLFVYCENEEEFETNFLINATYSSVNEIITKLFPNDTFAAKYELCEIILCEPSDALKNVGITVMDGPFFSIMPFGKTGLHSLTSVTFTPHNASFNTSPTFTCQGNLPDSFNCSEKSLGNCNLCPNKPQTAWPYMSRLANKYLKPEYEYKYKSSLYSMKPILKSSEVDDSRPTSIKIHCGKPREKDPVFISVLSGKINTVYDLDEYIK